MRCFFSSFLITNFKFPNDSHPNDLVENLRFTSKETGDAKDSRNGKMA